MKRLVRLAGAKPWRALQIWVGSSDFYSKSKGKSLKGLKKTSGRIRRVDFCTPSGDRMVYGAADLTM